jgi:hypothetical protein
LSPDNRSLHRILYVSAAAQTLTPAELDELLLVARANNALNDVTGALLYADGDFMQLLEGPREQVTETFRRIERSPMHRGVIALMNDPVDQREFATWSMAYSPATWDELKQAERACRGSADVGVALLKQFATGRARLER